MVIAVWALTPVSGAELADGVEWREFPDSLLADWLLENRSEFVFEQVEEFFGRPDVVFSGSSLRPRREGKARIYRLSGHRYLQIVKNLDVDGGLFYAFEAQLYEEWPSGPDDLKWVVSKDGIDRSPEPELPKSESPEAEPSSDDLSPALQELLEKRELERRERREPIRTDFPPSKLIEPGGPAGA